MQSWKAYLAHLEFPAPKVSWYDADFVQGDKIQACNVRSVPLLPIRYPGSSRYLRLTENCHPHSTCMRMMKSRTLDVSLIPNRCMEDGFEWSPKLTPILRIMWQDDAEN
jgi:hypothetical protein